MIKLISYFCNSQHKVKSSEKVQIHFSLRLFLKACSIKNFEFLFGALIDLTIVVSSHIFNKDDLSHSARMTLPGNTKGVESTRNFLFLSIFSSRTDRSFLSLQQQNTSP